MSIADLSLTGIFGTAAACQAIDEGAKTLLIDKMPVLGGNSAINGGVVMATGGFAYDVNFRQTIDPKLTADLDCTNHYGATAYALKTMMRNGADTVDLKWIQLGPWGSPDEKGFGIAPVFAIPAFSYGVMVDARTGKRFVNELADRKIRSDAILKMHKIKTEA